MNPSDISSDLTGGDSIPRKRGDKIPENLFLLRPENQAYLNGEITRIPPTKDEIQSRRISLILFVFLSPFLCGVGGFLAIIWGGGTVSFLRDNVSRGQLVGFTIFILMGWGFYLIPWIRASVQRSTLTQKGVLLIGQIESVSSKWEVKNWVNYYFVTVSYRVRLPNSKVMHSIETAIYMDMVGKPLPERGTPVAVVYVDENTKRLL